MPFELRSRESFLYFGTSQILSATALELTGRLFDLGQQTGSAWSHEQQRGTVWGWREREEGTFVFVDLCSFLNWEFCLAVWNSFVWSMITGFVDLLIQHFGTLGYSILDGIQWSSRIADLWLKWHYFSDTWAASLPKLPRRNGFGFTSIGVRKYRSVEQFLEQVSSLFTHFANSAVPIAKICMPVIRSSFVCVLDLQ